MNDTADWRWVDIDGTQHEVSLEELASLLSRDGLPEFVLVWQRGWTTWLHAMNVRELGTSLGPAKAKVPVAPPRSARVGSPPVPPTARYRAFLKGEQPATLLELGAAASRSAVMPPVPIARRSTVDPPTLRRRPVPVPVSRPPMPTIAEEPVYSHSPTLRPAGAIPPPPRAIPRMPVPALADPDEPDRDSSGPDLASAPSVDVSGTGPPARDPMAALGQPAERPVRGAGLFRSGRVSPIGLALIAMTGMLGLLTALLLLERAGGGDRRAATSSPDTQGAHRAPASVDAGGSPATTSVQACRVLSGARHLAASADLRVPPTLEPLTGSSRIAVGFASPTGEALVWTLEPATLEAEEAFRQPPRGPVVGVVPLTQREKLGFAVDRPGRALAFPRTVNAPQPFTLGVGSEGFTRLADGTATAIWPGQSDDPTITTPRVATTRSGHIVTFRHGGTRGKVLAGWLRPDGSRMTELGAVDTTDLVGTPTVAVNDRDALLTFAARAASSEHWSVAIAQAAHGQLPRRAVPFVIPDGGPGQQAISPGAAGLPGNGWLLQWTEGAAGNRRVRAQTLDGDLAPVGPPINLSPADRNSGQAVVWAGSGGNAIVLFLVEAANHHELWGVALKCS